MTNDDLKRFYNVNDKPEQNKDFVRYGSNGEIISEHDATKDEEVVNYRTLMQHASGETGGSKLYMHSLYGYSVTGDWTWKTMIFNASPEIITMQDIIDLVNKNVNIPVSGSYTKDETNRGILYCLTKSASGKYYDITFTRFSFVDGIFNMYPNNSISNVTGMLTDTVIEL